MGTLDVPGKGLIGSLEEYLTEVLKPGLKFIPHWGELDKSPSGKKLSRAFIEGVDSFTASLHGLNFQTSIFNLYFLAIFFVNFHSSVTGIYH